MLRRCLSFFCLSPRNACTRLDQFRIKKNVPQNKPIAVLTKRLFHEFRNKIESPSAISVRPSIRLLRSADEPGWIESEASIVFISSLLLNDGSADVSFASVRNTQVIFRALRSLR